MVRNGNEQYERFFMIPEETRFMRDLREYERKSAEIEGHLQAFLRENGFESTLYWVEGTQVAVLLTPADEKRHGCDFMHCAPYGDYKVLRSSSPLYSQWFKRLAMEGLRPVTEPMPESYLQRFYIQYSKVQEIDGVLYCHILAQNPFVVKDEWQEIRASDYYAILSRYYAVAENEYDMLQTMKEVVKK